MPVLPGAEPFFHSGGATGALLCHGFTGSPATLRPWADYLAAAGLTVKPWHSSAPVAPPEWKKGSAPGSTGMLAVLSPRAPALLASSHAGPGPRTLDAGGAGCAGASCCRPSRGTM